MRLALPAIVLCLLSTVSAFPQTPAPNPDGLDLLKHVSQRYADAKTYALAATAEVIQTGEYQRVWSKTVVAAAEAPDNRYYFEAHGNMGGAIRISDGKTAWKYHIEENHYTAQPAAGETKTKTVGLAEMALFDAENLRRMLADVAHAVHSASLDPDQTLTVNGKPVLCTVIRIRNADLDRSDPNTEIEKTIWIDKQQRTILKIEERRDIKHINVPRGPGLTEVTTRTYTKTELDGTVPDTVFTFVPPPGAVLLAKFPDPMDGYGLSTMTGDSIPPLKLKAADGKVVSIESFRGKPVLIDFWATWCAPCVAAMPKMAEIYKQGKDKGLVLLSVDMDEDATKAGDFLQKRGYSWPNFHDGDGDIARLMGSSPIPRVVLVDAKGQIAYDGTGIDENRVRTHLAELGPEFADLAPRAKTPPCDAAAQSH